jgi:DNA-binding response OmpR family regulator
VKILVVDDNVILSTVLADHLKEQGHEVTSAYDGQQAQQIGHRDRFELVITDLVLPGMDGLSLLERLRDDAPGMRAILISGFTELLEEEAIRIDSIGADSVISKPFEFAEIDAVIAGLGKQPGRPSAQPTPSP